MNDIFNPYTSFTIVYIDDVLVYFNSLEQHFKHLNIFLKVVKHAGLVVSAKKMKLFSSKVRLLGHNINKGLIVPIDRAISFADKFPDEIRDKQQLQRFLGSLNYIKDFYKDLAQDSKLLYQRLKKNPVPWSDEHAKAVRRLKVKVKELPCLALANPEAFKIVETDASEIGYGGILKQKVDNSEQLVRFTFGVWKPTQKNYSTVKKEMLAIVHAVSKFESDLLNKKFFIRVDCKAAKNILFKDVKNLASKQIFARWQGILSAFDFDIEFIKGETNALPDFLTREFWQGENKKFRTDDPKWWDKFTGDHLAPTMIVPALIPSPDFAAAQPLVTSSNLSVSQRLQLLIDQPGSSSSKEDLKKKILEILDLDDEYMASASATHPEDEVDPFANEDMLDNFHPELYGGPQ
ncbi:unnamed protein product [Prunus armeniaca]